jgi:hypothetical protein
MVRGEHEIVDGSYLALHQLGGGRTSRPYYCNLYDVRYQKSTGSFDRLWHSGRVGRRWRVTRVQAFDAFAAGVSEWRLGAALRPTNFRS